MHITPLEHSIFLLLYLNFSILLQQWWYYYCSYPKLKKNYIQSYLFSYKVIKKSIGKIKNDRHSHHIFCYNVGTKDLQNHYVFYQKVNFVKSDHFFLSTCANILKCYLLVSMSNPFKELEVYSELRYKQTL